MPYILEYLEKKRNNLNLQHAQCAYHASPMWGLSPSVGVACGTAQPATTLATSHHRVPHTHKRSWVIEQAPVLWAITAIYSAKHKARRAVVTAGCTTQASTLE